MLLFHHYSPASLEKAGIILKSKRKKMIFHKPIIPFR